jgi:hypothetical protein
MRFGFNHLFLSFLTFKYNCFIKIVEKQNSSLNLRLDFNDRVAVAFPNMPLHVLVDVGRVVTMRALDIFHDARVPVVVSEVSDKAALVGEGFAAVVADEVLLTQMNGVNVSLVVSLGVCFVVAMLTIESISFLIL